MAVIISGVVAFLSLCVAGATLGMSRHSAKRYKTQNEQQDQERHFNQQLIAMEILGIPGNSDWPSLRRRLERVHDLQHIMDERAGRIEMNIHDMQKELHPNGGGSMKDDVTAAKRLAEETSRQVATLTGVVQGMQERPAHGG